MEIRLVSGRVVWATVPDPQGRNAKSRRCVVVSNLDPAAPPAEVTVVYVTSSIDETRADEYVKTEARAWLSDFVYEAERGALHWRL